MYSIYKAFIVKTKTPINLLFEIKEIDTDCLWSY